MDPAAFRRRLMPWYREHARTLPWRGVQDPYKTWVSEIMLQQTRVAAVIGHYHEFLRRFPTLLALALALEPDVLAAWSGLGYYRRARMLHKAAQFVVLERHGRLPTTSAELRTLPGIGVYTAAAIASISFGESIAVVDGNVARVLLRLTGHPDDATAATTARIAAQAQALIPPRRLTATGNAAGDHNQAMMELGATICLPRAPLCLQCPVYALCLTRGEHLTPARAAQRSQPIAYLLDLRKRGPATEVLLALRPAEVSLMPGMYELPPIAVGSPDSLTREPVLRLRHAITNTNYYVQIHTPAEPTPEAEGPAPSPPKRRPRRRPSAGIPIAADDLHWVPTARLTALPLTGLARKVLQRLKVMSSAITLAD
jgi:A/G-specific adenine glycosylase